jgi:hypothetical protein
MWPRHKKIRLAISRGRTQHSLLDALSEALDEFRFADGIA